MKTHIARALCVLGWIFAKQAQVQAFYVLGLEPFELTVLTAVTVAEPAFSSALVHVLRVAAWVSQALLRRLLFSVVPARTTNIDRDR